MGKRKTTFYIEDAVLTATKLTGVATHRSESTVVEDSLRLYLIDEGRAEAARYDLRPLLDSLRQRSELNDLDDQAAMELAVQDIGAVRKERRSSRAAG